MVMLGDNIPSITLDVNKVNAMYGSTCAFCMECRYILCAKHTRLFDQQDPKLGSTSVYMYHVRMYGYDLCIADV